MRFLHIVLSVCALLPAVMPSPVRAADQKHLLVVTVTKGFRHDTIPTAEKVIGEMGAPGQFSVDYARTDAELAQKMSADGLKAYDGVVFASTTGDLPVPSPQAFLDWIKAGHAFVGIHSASDTFHGFRTYLEMLGGEFKEHGPEVGVKVHVADRRFPGLRDMGEAFDIPKEEIYRFQNFEPDQVHLLLYLDRHPNDGTPGLYPLAWCRKYGKGRVFYTALGHREDIWSAPWFRAHLSGGIAWTLGLVKGDSKPYPMPATEIQVVPK